MQINGYGISGILILFTMLFALYMKIYSSRSRSRADSSKEAFWERERAANSVRRKDISGLNYIDIPYDSLPFIENAGYNIEICQKELLALKGRKIVNLSGISNTDLKMEYGAANLPALSEYDDNCLHMFRSLANLGFHLSKEGYHKEAIQFLEFSIEAGTDISRSFLVLADEYIAAGEPDKIYKLKEKAEQITTAMGPSIVKELSVKLSHMSTE